MDFYFIGNCISYKVKTLRVDATGAQKLLQAKACAHQRAKSAEHSLFLGTLNEKENHYEYTSLSY